MVSIFVSFFTLVLHISNDAFSLTSHYCKFRKEKKTMGSQISFSTIFLFFWSENVTFISPATRLIVQKLKNIFFSLKSNSSIIYLSKIRNDNFMF